jgi:cyclo(L-tyrosyl-L-tyrosyl) synthase
MTVRLPHLSTPFTVEPLTANCGEILDRGDHVLIGISPGNSYFSEARIADLLRWGAAGFRRIDVVIPDSAEVETWRAVGYAEEQAHRRARAKAARVRNRVTRAWLAAGVPRDRFGLLLLSEVAEQPPYQRLLRESEDAITADTALHETYLRVGAKALRTYLHGVEPTRAQAERAMRYLVAETPLFLDTPGLLGVASSVAIYHHRLDFLDQVFHGGSALRPSRRQGFAVVRPT